MNAASRFPRLVTSDGQEFSLAEPLTVGRSESCAIHIEDNLVSRQHARIEIVNGRVMLTDLGSHNGTWVNETRIGEPVELHNGDRVRINKTTLVLQEAVPQPTLPASVPPPAEIIPPPAIRKESKRTALWQAAQPMALVNARDGTEIGLNQNITIGRDASNLLALAKDASASQFHAKIELQAGHLVISDLKSSNGTWVNGRRIAAPLILKHGDRIRLGDSLFRVRIGDRPLPPMDIRPSPQRRTVWGILLSGIFLIILIAGLAEIIPLVIQRLPTQTTASQNQLTQNALASATQDPVQQAMQALVYVFTPFFSGEMRSAQAYKTGSGSILDKSGIILTNFHVVGNVGESGEIGKKGDLSNDAGWIVAGLNPSHPDAEPDTFFLCRVIGQDQGLDLATLQVKQRGNFNLTELLQHFKDGTLGNLTFSDVKGDPFSRSLPIGDSDALATNASIIVIGYPGAGGQTPTVTNGHVSGLLYDESTPSGAGKQEPIWIKTDADINPGNSGGMAINPGGELIGVPTSNLFSNPVTALLSHFLQSSEKIGLVRPIKLALPLIGTLPPESTQP